MYEINQLQDGRWACVIQIQDGREHWVEESREKAVWNVIRGARLLNGDYITESDIRFKENCERSEASPDARLLDEIRRGEKCVLLHSDPRIKYKITAEECEMIIKIREGELRVCS